MEFILMQEKDDKGVTPEIPKYIKTFEAERKDARAVAAEYISNIGDGQYRIAALDSEPLEAWTKRVVTGVKQTRTRTAPAKANGKGKKKKAPGLNPDAKIKPATHDDEIL